MSTRETVPQRPRSRFGRRLLLRLMIAVAGPASAAPLARALLVDAQDDPGSCDGCACPGADWPVGCVYVADNGCPYRYNGGGPDTKLDATCGDPGSCDGCACPGNAEWPVGCVYVANNGCPYRYNGGGPDTELDESCGDPGSCDGCACPGNAEWPVGCVYVADNGCPYRYNGGGPDTKLDATCGDPGSCDGCACPGNAEWPVGCVYVANNGCPYRYNGGGPDTQLDNTCGDSSNATKGEPQTQPVIPSPYVAADGCRYEWNGKEMAVTECNPVQLPPYVTTGTSAGDTSLLPPPIHGDPDAAYSAESTKEDVWNALLGIEQSQADANKK